MNFTDHGWSIIAQLAGLFVAIRIGLRLRSGRSPMLATIVLGIAVDVIANVVLFRNWFIAIVDLFGLPVIYFLTAWIAYGLHAVLREQRRSKSKEY